MKTFFQRPDHVLDGCGERAKLYVLTAIFNATRYRTRWKHYEDFAKHVEEAGGILYTVEAAFGGRDFVVTEPGNPRHLQLRTDTEIWHKERALNLLISRLPLDWQYCATVDADIDFARHDWANETIHQLQHFDVVQMWSQAEDLNADNEGIQTHNSFVYSWLNHEVEACEYYGGSAGGHFNFHPGFAWGYRRSAIDALGGLIDWGIAGSGDKHMAKALIGEADDSIHPGLHDGYRFLVKQWEQRALKYIKKNIGYVPGKLLHYWHGPKSARGYFSRWKILVDNQFDPIMDIKNDWHGMMQLVTEEPRQLAIRDQLRDYFRSRNEDQL